MDRERDDYPDPAGTRLRPDLVALVLTLVTLVVLAAGGGALYLMMTDFGKN